jgi:uncharacterized protein
MPRVYTRRRRLLWSGMLIGSTLAVTACHSDAKPPPKRAIVPIDVLGDRLAICRSEKDQPVPGWANSPVGGLWSVTRTRDEVSIILADARAPLEAKCERGWRLLMVKGPLDFNQVGIIAGLSGTLADAGVSIFALSTYDTDYIMVRHADLDRALAVLRQAGYPVSQLAL